MLVPYSSKTIKSSKARTHIVKKSCDPVFNQTLIYPGLAPSDIRDKGMKMSVVDSTNLRNIVLGMHINKSYLKRFEHLKKYQEVRSVLICIGPPAGNYTRWSISSIVIVHRKELCRHRMTSQHQIVGQLEMFFSIISNFCTQIWPILDSRIFCVIMTSYNSPDGFFLPDYHPKFYEEKFGDLSSFTSCVALLYFSGIPVWRFQTFDDYAIVIVQERFVSGLTF